MKVAICSEKRKYKEIVNLLKIKGIRVVEEKPDIVLCYDGDGTILYAERIYPLIPKLVIKSYPRKLGAYGHRKNEFEGVLERVKDGNYSIGREMKIKAFHSKKVLNALNEIQVHNKIPTKAIRFSLLAGRRKIENIIGDGAIVSTPFGSTGYYTAVGGKRFKEGIGIAFNNTIQKVKNFVIPRTEVVKIRIKRGPGLLIADNNEEFIDLDEGSKVIVKESKEEAEFIQ